MPENSYVELKPEILWKRFYEISAVPRPSKKEEKVTGYLKDLLKKLKVPFKEDRVGNIVALLPATKGYENSPTVVLQGHLDMVCEKNKGKKHDFENDPITVKIEGDWVTADGTTLGSDNGIGIAAALAVITDPGIVHGPVEILMTVDEETGLTGANNLEKGMISGKILLNLDSEEEGTFYVGCSGGIDTVAEFKIESEPLQKGTVPYALQVSGLKGGHSGLDINLNRANAIKILARALDALRDFNYGMAKIEGGSKRNAIPREAEVTIYIDPKETKTFDKFVKELQLIFLNEYKISDSGLKLEFNPGEFNGSEKFTRKFSQKIINTLLALPHGVIQMSQDIPDLVETSTNLATVVTSDDKIIIGTSQRSSVESAKNYIANSVYSLFELAGADVKKGDGYPGWKPNLESGILKLSKQVYGEIFNKTPEIKAIHAGLECGILGDKEPGLDMISFGPTIQGAHSPDEKVNIETVDKFYMLLKSILKRIAENK